jgi:hypothetical protein
MVRVLNHLINKTTANIFLQSSPILFSTMLKLKASKEEKPSPCDIRFSDSVFTELAIGM